MNKVLGLFASILLFAAFSGAMADQRDARLDPLFERLKATTVAAEAEEIATSIRGFWALSGSDEADKLMAVGLSALRDGAVWDAVRSFDLAVFRAPDFAEGHNMRATAYYFMGNTPSAIKELRSRR